LDLAEDMRFLTIEEWNLRDILKSHVLALLQNQKTYWKQRGRLNGSNWEMKIQDSFIQNQ
jgi:hypothetical protein